MKVSLGRSVNLKMGLVYTLFIIGILYLCVFAGVFYPPYLKIVDTFVTVTILLMSLKFLISIYYGSKKVPEPAQPKRYPMVSVIVPAYNEERVLDRTIQDMLKVDYPRHKIEYLYVYESKCTDRTEEIIRKYARRDPRIRPVKRTAQHGGKAAAANYGIRRARGEIVFSVDADHSPSPDAVKRAVAHFQDPKVACVKGRCRGLNKSESIIAKLSGVERDMQERTSIYSWYTMGGFSIFGGGQAFLRKRIFEDIGYFDEEIMTEDIEYSVRIHKAGYKIVADPTVETWEENPPTLMGWWHQRKRWTRGWMQVARRYIPQIPKMKRVPLKTKVDMFFGLSFTLLPLLTTLWLPLLVFVSIGYQTALFPYSYMLPFYITFMLTPISVAATSWLLDIQAGEKPRWNEIPSLIFMLPFVIVHFAPAWAAFLDEFFFNRPSEYVKTVRSKDADKASTKHIVGAS